MIVQQIRGRVRSVSSIGRKGVRTRTVIAEVFVDGQLIWTDNSGAGAWAGLVKDATDVTRAARLMTTLGQTFDPWDAVCARAPKM